MFIRIRNHYSAQLSIESVACRAHGFGFIAAAQALTPFTERDSPVGLWTADCNAGIITHPNLSSIGQRPRPPVQGSRRATHGAAAQKPQSCREGSGMAGTIGRGSLSELPHDVGFEMKMLTS